MRPIKDRSGIVAPSHEPADVPFPPEAGGAAIAAREPEPPGYAAAEAAAVLQAAEALFRDPKSDPVTEPATPILARLAVERFAELFASAPGVFTDALDGARAGAEVLSSDRLQGLAEIVQNADDSGATWVRFHLEPDALLVAHDGRPVNLRDVLALSTPWLTTKSGDARATGRFGIGLMTLQALSRTLEVYSGPYAIGLGHPSLSWVEPVPSVAAALTEDTTLLRIPFDRDALSADDLADWLDRWDDSALLFCSHVRGIEVHAGEKLLRTLKLSWTEAGAEVVAIQGRPSPVRRRHARAQDGRMWIVHTAETPPPADVERARKARAETMPLGVALPLFGHEQGMIYAGLPVAATHLPVRLHAQFDPTASRQDLAATPWNRALFPYVTDLWEIAVVRLLADAPACAWPAIPLPAGEVGPAHELAKLEQALLAHARAELPRRGMIRIGEQTLPLTEMAVEVARLTGVITGSETARLAKLPAALPAAARDAEDRWRAVLEDWRTAAAPLPPPVSVETALDLFLDLERPPDAVIALAAAAIDEDLGERLATLPSVVLEDGSHTPPPTRTDPWVLLERASGLGSVLGIARALHLAYRADSEPAQTVLRWLAQAGALLENPDDHSILQRLARAGESGQRLPEVLSDPQISALRDAFEGLSPEMHARLGPGVGRAIHLHAHRFDQRGRRQKMTATPAEAYLPQGIEKERDSFAMAAGHAPGLTWIDARYARVLRSPLGRAGLGPARFLRLLGAETAPRLVPHPQLFYRFMSERKRGLSIYVADSPGARSAAMNALGATYTLEDRYSPDLDTVLRSIARERRARRRRERATAMLETLGRAWDRFGEQSSVTAAWDSYSWHRKGEVRAFWVWQAATIPWLDDVKGAAAPPVALRVRTPGTLAVYGPDADGYLHPELQTRRLNVLSVIGVAGDPNTGALVARLRNLRDQPSPGEDVATETAAIYRALADRLADPTHLLGDLSPAQLLTAFNHPPGLILTNQGWKRASEVLSGDPIFGDRRAFVPGLREMKRLWTTLKVRSPSLGDCVDVLAEMGRARRQPDRDDFVVMLESLRLLAKRRDEIVPGSELERRLARLPLWTSQGWTTRRPVYAVGDLPLADGLSTVVPVWMPGGEVAQFRTLLTPLRITEISAASTVVLDAEEADIDVEATETLRRAVRLLKEDLVRNEPAAAGQMRTEWDRLTQFEVRVAPSLRVRIEGVRGKEELTVSISAKADLGAGVLYLRDPRDLARVDGGGRALAGLFGADARRLAQAWLAACEEARAGREAEQLQLAVERAAVQQRETQERLAEFQSRITEAHTKGRHAGGKGRDAGSGTLPPPPAGGGSTPASPPSAQPTRRSLVDPLKFQIVDPRGKLENPNGSARKTAKRPRGPLGPLASPKPGGTPPQPSTPPAPYSGGEKEKVGLDLLRKVLATDAEEVRDLRAQRGIGADAMDLDERYYEMKVHAGPEPDQITLEASQVQRALTSPDFFLVIVSEVEGDHARPKVRIIVDPLAQLEVAERSSLLLTGVRAAQSLVYEFEHEGKSA